MDKTMRAAVKIEQKMLDNIDAAYRNILHPVLKKHRRTLEKLDKLMQDGATARASALWRRSGIITDLAAAIAGAGHASSVAIRQGLQEIREVAAREG
nr:hypothetical protein [Clostridia bacterium]